MFDDIFDKAMGYGGRLTDAAVDSVIQSANPGKPDFTKFMERVGQYDLSRPNLFLVRFTDFSANIKGDDVISRSLSQNMDLLLDFGIEKIVDYGQTVVLNSDIGRKALGAIDPDILRTIIPGEFLDGIIPNGTDLNKDIAILVKAVSSPGTNFDATKTYHDRTPTPVVKGRNFDNIKITFYLTPGQVERSAFISWMEKVHNPKNNTYGMYEDYAQDIEIYSLDRKGNPKGVTKCIGCFPVSVSGVDFDVDNNNTVATFEVEFTISRMVVKRFNDKPLINEAASIGGEILNDITGSIFS